MNEKLLHRFEHSWQAEAASMELDKQNISFRTNTRPREYVAVLTGGAGDSVDIYVDEADHVKASMVLNTFLIKNNESISDEPLNEKNYFKRVIIFSIFGMFLLPIIFNWAATANYTLLKKQKVPAFKKAFALAVLMFAWIISLVEAYLVAKIYL